MGKKQSWKDHQVQKKKADKLVYEAVDKSKYDLEWYRNRVEDHNYLLTLRKNLAGIKRDASKFDLDWVFVGSGMEGSGKSTLTLQELILMDPEFDLQKQATWNLLDFTKASKKYRDQPGKVILIDEIAKMAFSRDALAKANKILVKLFISNRSFKHFYFLNVPSFFWLDKYIRQFRIKTLNYSYLNWLNPSERYFLFYSRKKYKNLVFNEKDTKRDMLDPDRMSKNKRFNFQESFEAIPSDTEFWQEYFQQKEEFQDRMLSEALEDAKSLEDKGKIGFHSDMDLDEFVEWLHANFNYKGTNMIKETQKEIAKHANKDKAVINELINKAVVEGYLSRPKRSQYNLTDKGREAVHGNGGKDERD